MVRARIDQHAVPFAAGDEPSRRPGFKAKVKRVVNVKHAVQFDGHVIEPGVAITGQQHSEVDVPHRRIDRKLDRVAGPVLRSGDATTRHVVEGENAGGAVDSPPQAGVAARDAFGLDVGAIASSLPGSARDRK